ncbi:hypothetical protein [Candidatus Amoebophilus asiaticus]|nr:hypothetical protein [Candidatus Amoebophilus asiaticus]
MGSRLSGRQGYYQLALIQKGMEQFLHQLTHAIDVNNPFLTPAIRTRAGHQVNFVQQANHWLALVNENSAPGFSRTLALPVLYPTGRTLGQLERQIIHTVESLLTASSEIQKNLIHIVFPEKALQKKGYVYTGVAMGLEGGGLWSKLKSIGRSIARFACTVVSVAGSVVSTLLTGDLLGAISAGIEAFNMCMQKREARKRAREELNTISNCLEKVGEEALRKVSDVINTEVDRGPKSYMNFDKILAELRKYRGEIVHAKDELEEWRNAHKESNYFLYFQMGEGDKNFQAKVQKDDKIIWAEDIKFYNKKISYARETINKIDKYIEEVKNKCRNQAWKDVEETSRNVDNLNTECVKAIRSDIENLSVSGGLDSLESSYRSMQNQIAANISMFEEWKKQSALSDADKLEIDNKIQRQKDKLAGMQPEKDLLEYAKKRFK